MTGKEKYLLIKQAARLAMLGAKVEKERGKVLNLSNQGISLSHPRLLKLYGRFNNAAAEWQKLESEHAELIKKLSIDI